MKDSPCLPVLGKKSVLPRRIEVYRRRIPAGYALLAFRLVVLLEHRAAHVRLDLVLDYVGAFLAFHRIGAERHANESVRLELLSQRLHGIGIRKLLSEPLVGLLAQVLVDRLRDLVELRIDFARLHLHLLSGVAADDYHDVGFDIPHPDLYAYRNAFHLPFIELEARRSVGVVYLGEEAAAYRVRDLLASLHDFLPALFLHYRHYHDLHRS